jgi:uncharacterized protein YndB with AHSA1/START domain
MTTVRREIVLPLSREEAWELLADPAWLADEVEFAAEEGGLVEAAWEDGETRVGVVEELEPERRVRFRWMGEQDASEVEWTLDDVAAGTRLVVVERALTPVPGSWAPRALAAAPALALA